MTLRDLHQLNDFTFITENNDLDKTLQHCFTGDVLSVVMAKAKKNDVWVTIHNHINIIAVACLQNLSCIIITEGNHAPVEVVDKAMEKNLIIIETKLSSFETIKKLIQMGM